MSHSGNTATVVDVTYGGEGCTARIYVHDELQRFVTVARVSFSTKDLTVMLDGVLKRRAELDQATLFD